MNLSNLGMAFVLIGGVSFFFFVVGMIVSISDRERGKGLLKRRTS
jgi:hypothetical protein